MPSLSIVVPFHRNIAHLAGSLAGLRTALNRIDQPDKSCEIIVVADGATEPCSELVTEMAGRVVNLPTQSGPAVARNRGAAVARGPLLVFVDSDVVVAPDALRHIVSVFDREPDLAALFGAYDENPHDVAFISQARNLSHSFVHQRSRSSAGTFWAGLGAVRAESFAAVGGFDERFARPSVEDIDLGYRLRAAGCRIALDSTIRGTHLKVWSLWSGLRTDLFDRGIPWTQLLHRYRSLEDDLNLSRVYRACVIVAWLAAISALGACWRPALGWITLACLVGLVGLEWPYYAWFARHRGLLFTARWYPLHVVHHLSNGLSFAIGTALFVISHVAGRRWPGALPAEAWQGPRIYSRVGTE
ncbi:MAG TPA: glycosyltransferase [Vicinamibacterales bacterium]|nr:glycosyltransferase [Vicinamibacterales bacterium]